jgi:alanine racemase
MKTWLEISKDNILHNLKEFRRILGKDVKIMAVVKSNAYGHGLAEMAGILKDKGVGPLDKPEDDKLWLGVDSIDEAIILKKTGVEAPILILGYTELSGLKDAVEGKFRLTVYNKEAITALGKLQKPAKVHLKIETGTTRQGINENEILGFIEYARKFKNIEIEGLSTHFANIEDTTDHAYAKKQLARFESVITLLTRGTLDSTVKGAPCHIPIKHVACSAAAILFKETHFNMARIGIGMYGMWSSKETFVSAKHKLKLKPALTWKTIIAQIKKVKKGTPVSYGLTEKVSRDSLIAVLPIGYYDGLDRGLSSIGNVLVRGKRCKILGRICMNMCMVDVTDVKNVKLEDEVVLLGRQGREEITAEELAGKLGTINYEVVTRINPGAKRVVV